jgi:nicotinate-nucleotide pyrophosphorylase (carboxylating)
VRCLVRYALLEDIGTGDVGAEFLVPAQLKCRAVIVARSAGVVAGLPVARLVFAMIDRRLRFVPCALEGSRVRAGQVVARLHGRARSVLAGERVALNFLQRLSGIATLTRKYVAAVRPYATRILDTRKTTPCLRLLEKYAVQAGGGMNHRMGLYDGIMAKDNYLALLRADERARRPAGPTAVVNAALTARLTTARTKAPRGMLFEGEAQSLDDVRLLLAAGVPIVMLDNMSIREMISAVKLIRKSDRASGRRTTIEASGGMTLRNVAAVARTGVNWISIGALTHSAPPLDISLEIREASEAPRIIHRQNTKTRRDAKKSEKQAAFEPIDNL